MQSVCGTGFILLIMVGYQLKLQAEYIIYAIYVVRSKYRLFRYGVHIINIAFIDIVW